MSKGRRVLLSGAVLLMALASWLLWIKQERESTASGKVEPNRAAEHSTAAVPVTPSEASVPSASVTPEIISTADLPLAEEDDAATQYAAELRYPSYSQPYRQSRHPADETHYDAIAMQQQDGSTWSLAMQQYRFYQPQPLVFTVTYPADLPLSQFTFEVLSLGQERLLAQTSVAAKPGIQQWQVKPGNDWPEELVLRVSSGRGHSIRAPFELVRPVATITAVKQASVQGEDLVVPLELDTDEAGLYQIQGLLMARGEVIARLVETQALQQGSEHAVLKVHGSVLPATSQALSITALRLQRMSPAPNVPPRFGTSRVETASIGDFGQADVSFQPYQPTPEEQQRLQFLRGN